MAIDFNFSFPITTGIALTVGQLNLAISSLLERGMPVVKVRGEVSNFMRAASGHWYFSLKDESAQIRCVMFRARNQVLGFQPREGQLVEVGALVSLYMARGDLQLNVESMRALGAGDLFGAFLALKEKLANLGLFDTERKQTLPSYPRRVGVITSLQAAALADVLAVFARRAPHIAVIVYPAPVQGAEAALKLAAMLDRANLRAEVDLIVLCRGGGSIEDLWAFNEEVLAHAIARSHLPVVTGIGHETDFTIADFVADLRAPTPTAAAELVSLERATLLLRVQQAQQYLQRALRRYLERHAQCVDNLARQLVHPRAQVREQHQLLSAMRSALQYALRFRLTQAQALCERRQSHLLAVRPRREVLRLHLDKASTRLQIAYKHGQAQAQNRWQMARTTLEMLNPQRILDRGYAVLLDEKGRALRHPEQLQERVELALYLAQGKAAVTLATVKPLK